MKKEPKIFVIIVTYKGMRWYDKCFGSLRESTIPLQTVVVDNTPGDEDAAYIKTHFPEVYLIKTNENLGFGRANNLGMRYALDNGCDYVFLLNQDTWIEKDSIAKLAEVADKNPEYGILSPMHLNAEHTVVNAIIGIGKEYRNEKLLSDLYLNKVNDVYETNYVNAAAWLLPRKTLEFVGGFDPIFKHYEEDDNYLNRVIFHGMKIGICPKAQITHDHQGSALSDESLVLRRRQIWLVKWTDINQSFSIRHMVCYNIRKWIVSVCTGRIKMATHFRRQLLYAISMCEKIKYSRKENKKQQAAWL
jgi:GT2 family glycosyltransferase